MSARFIRRLFATGLAGATLAAGQPAFAQKDPVYAQKGTSPAAPTTTADQPLTPKQVTEIGTRGACWIVRGHDGLNHRGHGSGWVLDRSKRLIVTNEHVVAGLDVVEVYFPVWNSGKVHRDYQDYLLNRKPVRGVVIDRNKFSDLALVQVDEIPDTVQALTLARQSAEEGDLVRTIGALPQGNEALWGTVSGEVRLVARRPNSNGGIEMMMVTSMPTNRGNSGGAILNARGEVVGVVEGGYSGPTRDGQITLSVTMHVDLSEVRTFLRDAVPLAEPETAAQFLLRGQRRLWASRTDMAAGDFSETLRREPKNVSALIGRGKALAAKGDHATAIGDFDAALKIDESAYDAYVFRGRSRTALGRVDEAVADATEAIRLKPGIADPYVERGNAYHNSGRDYTAAVADYSRAIEITPKAGYLYANRGRSHDKLGQTAEAVADLRKAVELDGNDEWAWSALGNIYLWKSKQYDDAFQAFLKTATLNPNEPLHFADLGSTLAESGQHAKALEFFDKALTMNRERRSRNLHAAATYLNRGLSRKATKDTDGAHADFNEAIRLDPKYARAYTVRGNLLQELGREADAKADFDSAARLSGGTTTTVAPIAAGLSIVGTWETNAVINGVRTYERSEVRADGTVSTTVRARGRDGYWREVQDTGTYTLTGNQLTVTLRTMGTLTSTVERTGDTVRLSRTDGLVLTYTRVK